MRNALPRIIVALLFLTILALPLVWARIGKSSLKPGQSESSSAAPGSDSAPLRLVIYTPHNEQIRYEVARAFSAWYLEHHHHPVTIDWRNVGGTSDIERILRSQFTTLARSGIEENGVGVDLVFGGGDYSFEYVLKAGINDDHVFLPARDTSLAGKWSSFTDDKFQKQFRENLLSASSDPSSIAVVTYPAPALRNQYHVRLWWPKSDDNATNVTVTVKHAAGEKAITINQRAKGDSWVDIGVFDFAPGDSVTLSTADTDGRVLAPAVLFTRNIPLTQSITIDPQLKADAFRAPLIADKKLYDPDGHWWGVVLSSFGIVYNNDVLHTLGLPEPQTWSDLTDPRYIGWIALADPSHSGSVKVTYEAILQRYGFDRGVKVLRRAFASSRYFAPGSTQIPIDVSSGEAAAGMCIDYYARQQAEATGLNRTGYVAPADATVITADPVAVLRGAPHRELAVKFIEFLLTEQGQALWDFKVGDPMGPQKFALRRAPIRRDIYEKYPDRLIDPVNPFDIAQPLPQGVPAYFSVIPVFLHSMCMDIHDDLRAAWVAINNTPDGELKTKMLAEFDALPFTADELVAARKAWKLDPRTETADRLRWTAFFRAQYQKVVAMSRQ